MSCNTFEEFEAQRGAMFKDKDMLKLAWEDYQKVGPLDRLTEDEMRRLAIDIVDGLVWTDRQGMESFHAVVRLAMDSHPDQVGKFFRSGMIYEYMSEAGPLAINGMPMFMSFRLLAEEDLGMMLECIAKQVKLKEDFKNSLRQSIQSGNAGGPF